MNLLEHVKMIDNKSKEFDINMMRNMVATETVFKIQDISFDERSLDILESFDDKDDIEDVYKDIIIESSSKISDILSKTRQAFEDYNTDIDNTIKEKILNDKTDALFKKINQKLKANPSMKNRKVEIHDSKKEMGIIFTAISDTEKEIAKIKSSGLSKDSEDDIDKIHTQCQKDRKKVGKIEMTTNDIIKSLTVPTKIGNDILTYEKDIAKLSESTDKKDQEKARVMIKAHLNIVKMAKEIRSVELHADIEQLRELKNIFASSSTVKESTEEETYTEAVVNDKKIAKINSQISSYIATIKTYIRVAKTIQKNPNLKGTTPAELKGFVKECSVVISELRVNRQKLQNTVRKAKLKEDPSFKEKILGDTEVNTVLDSIKQTFASVNSLKKKMNKISRPNRKIIRTVKHVETVESTDILDKSDEEIMKEAVADIFSL